MKTLGTDDYEDNTFEKVRWHHPLLFDQVKKRAVVIFGDLDERNAWDKPLLSTSNQHEDKVVTPARVMVEDNGSLKEIREGLILMKDELSLSLENSNSQRYQETFQQKKSLEPSC